MEPEPAVEQNPPAQAEAPAGSGTQPAVASTPVASPLTTCVAIFLTLGMAAGGIGGFIALFQSSGRFPILAIPLLAIAGAIAGAILGGIIGGIVVAIRAITSKRKPAAQP